MFSHPQNAKGWGWKKEGILETCHTQIQKLLWLEGFHRFSSAMAKRSAGIEAMPSPPNPEEPFAHLEEDDCHSLKRPRGPLPSPTPEARDHARHSELWDLPVKELKARLRAIGADFTGLAEKTELIMLLERSVELRRKEYLHTENIPTFVL
ncbi:unnamed protein product [Effrenium voratum]|nr:unnamed protein product [Effrenium voratum]